VAKFAATVAAKKVTLKAGWSEENDNGW
jgi:hypothetical protein